MIWRLIGGLSDGETFDTDDPPPNWSGEFTVPAPKVLRVHDAPSNRTVYRLVSATPEEAVYQFDADATAEARRMSRGEWRDADDDD